jgi:hypothetical protein
MPEVGAIDLKEFTRGLAEEADQRSGMRTARGCRGETEQEFLKRLIRALAGASYDRRFSRFERQSGTMP